jgi:hypothetical protein
VGAGVKLLLCHDESFMSRILKCVAGGDSIRFLAAKPSHGVIVSQFNRV